MKTLMHNLDEYLTGLEAQGEKIPSRTDRKRPNFRRISTLSGIDYKLLTSAEGKKRINLAVRQIGLDTTPDSARLRQLRFEENSRQIGLYLQWLQKQGQKLPQNPVRGGEIFFTQVEAEAGLQLSTLIVTGKELNDSYRVQLRKMVESAAARQGIETRILSQYMGQEEVVISYELLLRKGAEARKEELKERSNAAQQLYNTRAALRLFCKTLDLDLTARVGAEFVADIDVHIRQVLDRIENVGSCRKFQTEIRWWFDCYQKIVKAATTPDDFHQAFARLVDNSGLSFGVLRKLLGVSLSTVTGWYRGTKTPQAKSLPAIYRMESLCKLQAGTLVSKIVRPSLYPHVLPSQLPEFLLDDLPLAYKVSPHLPDDFLDLSPERQKLIFDSVCNDIIKSSDPFTKRLVELQHLPYRLMDWPAPLRQEFEDLAAFKTADQPPLGMNRDQRWRPTTEEMVRKALGFFYGALALPTDAGDIRLRGLGLPVTQLSIALVACPLLVEWYIRFQMKARCGNASTAIKLLRNIISLLQPDTGWLWQKPELAPRLRPVSCDPTDSLLEGSTTTELVPQELVAKAQTDWREICQNALRHYAHLCKRLKQSVEVGRDPFLPIEGIVNMDDPMKVFPLLVQKMRSDMPNRKTQPGFYHIAVRNCALVLLICATGLRRNTVAQLNYTGDSKGHLTFQGGSYVLNIPRHLFKEENSPYFGPENARQDYFMSLPNVLGMNEILSEYLNVSRPFLLNSYYPGCEDKALFVTRKGGRSPRLSPQEVSALYRTITVRYLVENKWRGTGLPQVKPHGPHCARHIRGTASVIKTGSFQIAGDANHNSERMARQHYARFAPKNRNRRVNSVLFDLDK